jgi:hypothetical protein
LKGEPTAVIHPVANKGSDRTNTLSILVVFIKSKTLTAKLQTVTTLILVTLNYIRNYYRILFSNF